MGALLDYRTSIFDRGECEAKKRDHAMPVGRNMKSAWVVSWGIVFVVLTSSWALENNPMGTLTFLIGEVQVQPNGETG